MRKVFASVLGIAAMVVASCSGPVPGNAGPPATGEPGTSTRSPGSSAALNVPKVTDPIDMTKYKQNPCAALTESQLEKLNLPVEPQTRMNAPAGPTCDWEASDDTGYSLGGGPVTAGPGSSLAGAYKKNRQGAFDNFKPITVAGYPGVLTRADGEKDTCGAAVAVRNDLLYSLSGRVPEGSPYYGKPCVYLKKAIKMATITMSGSDS